MEINVNTIDKNMRPKEVEKGTAWYSVGEPNSPLRLAGFYWYEEDKCFRRLPLRHKEAIKKVNEGVDFLAGNTAGGQIKFKTDATTISVRAKLTGPSNMYNMSTLGQSAFDCYVALPNERYYAELIAIFDHWETQYESPLFIDGEKGIMKDVIIYFPLYNGVEWVDIGVSEGAQIYAPDDMTIENPIVIYGTSIAQCGCASKPGLGYTNIISRKMNANVLNLGFSGSALGELELAEPICEIENPSAIIIDIEANAGDVNGTLTKNLYPFVERVRKTHTEVPLLIVSRLPYRPEMHNPKLVEHRNAMRAFQRELVETYQAKGDAHIHFLDGFTVLGEDFDDCYVDAVHPNDLGFVRMADKFIEVLKEITK